MRTGTGQCYLIELVIAITKVSIYLNSCSQTLPPFRHWRQGASLAFFSRQVQILLHLALALLFQNFFTHLAA